MTKVVVVKVLIRAAVLVSVVVLIIDVVLMISVVLLHPQDMVVVVELPVNNQTTTDVVNVVTHDADVCVTEKGCL